MFHCVVLGRRLLPHLLGDLSSGITNSLTNPLLNFVDFVANLLEDTFEISYVHPLYERCDEIDQKDDDEQQIHKAGGSIDFENDICLGRSKGGLQQEKQYEKQRQSRNGRELVCHSHFEYIYIYIRSFE